MRMEVDVDVKVGRPCPWITKTWKPQEWRPDKRAADRLTSPALKRRFGQQPTFQGRVEVRKEASRRSPSYKPVNFKPHAFGEQPQQWGATKKGEALVAAARQQPLKLPPDGPSKPVFDQNSSNIFAARLSKSPEDRGTPCDSPICSSINGVQLSTPTVQRPPTPVSFTRLLSSSLPNSPTTVKKPIPFGYTPASSISSDISGLATEELEQSVASNGDKTAVKRMANFWEKEMNSRSKETEDPLPPKEMIDTGAIESSRMVSSLIDAALASRQTSSAPCTPAVSRKMNTFVTSSSPAPRKLDVEISSRMTIASGNLSEALSIPPAPPIPSSMVSKFIPCSHLAEGHHSTFGWLKPIGQDQSVVSPSDGRTYQPALDSLQLIGQSQSMLTSQPMAGHNEICSFGPTSSASGEQNHPMFGSTSTTKGLMQTFPKSKDGQNVNLHFSTSNSLPPTNSPTITLLQKGREGQLPMGALYMSKVPLQPAQEDLKKKTNEKLYLLPGEDELRRVPEDADAPKYNGIGPLDCDGLPLGLRMGVEEKNQKQWYKKMYQQLHTADKEDELRIVKMVRSERPSSSTSNKGRSYSPADASYRNEVYRNQPKSIINYEPGFSSIALNQGSLEENYSYNPPMEKPGQLCKYVDEGIGIELSSKGTLQASSPKKNYRNIQKGADIPVSGLQLPFPEKHETNLDDLILQFEEEERNLLRPPSATSSGDCRSHGSSPSQSLDRRKREEDQQRRKSALNRITWEQRERRAELQKLDNESRKHTDHWMEREKSPIPPAALRFDEDSILRLSPRPIAAHAQALYDFEALNTRELDFRKGDNIILLKSVDHNWMLGEHNGRQGIFPLCYVQTITSLEEAKYMSRQKEGFAKVKADFKPANKEELFLSKNDNVKLLSKLDSNWYVGIREDGRKGILPATYITVLKEPESSYRPDDSGSLPSAENFRASAETPKNLFLSEIEASVGAASPNSSYHPLCQVMFTYTPLNNDELDLKEGDLVSVVEKCDDGWCVGISQRTLQFGTFPGNYVQSI